MMKKKKKKKVTKKKDDKKNTILYPEHYNLVEEELAQLSELFEADRPKSMEQDYEMDSLCGINCFLRKW